MNQHLKPILRRLTQKDASQLLGVSRSTIGRWKRQGVPAARRAELASHWSDLKAIGLKPVKSLRDKRANEAALREAAREKAGILSDSFEYVKTIEPARTTTVGASRHIYEYLGAFGTFTEADFDSVIEDTRQRTGNPGAVVAYIVVEMDDGSTYQTPMSMDMTTLAMHLENMASNYDIDPFEIDEMTMITQTRETLQ